ERPGPTGVILTTTQIRLHPENETRLLSVPVDDTPEQTRRVLASIAEHGNEACDLGEWHALQEWLALRQTRVSIPFARAFAAAIDPVAVRLRRDFGALLSLIRAHAILHRATREVGEHGVVATLEDYRVVRNLITDLIAEAAQVGASDAIRETV